MTDPTPPPVDADALDRMVDEIAEILWRRMSDVLERRAFPFSEAPSRLHYLAHGRAVAQAIAARLRDQESRHDRLFKQWINERDHLIAQLRDQDQQIERVTAEQTSRALKAADAGIIATRAIADKCRELTAERDEAITRAETAEQANQRVRRALDRPLTNGGGMRGLADAVSRALDGGGQS